MFRNLLTRLFEEEYQPGHRLGAEDGEIAIAALLVRIARADDRYTAAEQHRIEAILATRRGVPAHTVTERRLAAEMIEAEAPDTDSLIRAIKERIAFEDRADLVAALWEIAAADDRQTPQELAAVRMAAGLLGINEVDSSNASRMIVGKSLSDSS